MVQDDLQTKGWLLSGAVLIKGLFADCFASA